MDTLLSRKKKLFTVISCIPTAHRYSNHNLLEEKKTKQKMMSQGLGVESKKSLSPLDPSLGTYKINWSNSNYLKIQIFSLLP